MANVWALPNPEKLVFGYVGNNSRNWIVFCGFFYNFLSLNLHSTSPSLYWKISEIYYLLSQANASTSSDYNFKSISLDNYYNWILKNTIKWPDIGGLIPSTLIETDSKTK